MENEARNRTPSCDLVTEEEFDSFELVVQWKISPGGNSGVMYRVVESPAPPYTTGPEYQIIDNARNSDARRAETSAASCYNLYGPTQDATKPAGEWNQARILVNGNHVEHWLNGIKMVEYELGSPDWQRRVQASRFKDMPLYGKGTRGRIDLQDQGHPVAYRNLKIRPLKQSSAKDAGLMAELYQGRNFEHKVKVRIEPQVNGEWVWTPDKDVPLGPFSIRWTGWLQAAEPGRYKLIAFVDDGARLWLDNQMLINQWFEGGGKRIETEVGLTEGRHSLRIDYFDFGAPPAHMKLFWQKQGLGEQRVVPATALFHDPEAYQRSAVGLLEEEKRFYASKPKDAVGYLVRADAYCAKQDFDRALTDYKEWLRLVPPNPNRMQEPAAYYNERAWYLAISRETAGRFGDIAVALARRACALTGWKNWMYLDTLAAAYADAGQYNLAVLEQAKAVNLAKDANKKRELSLRLRLYEARKPYRELATK